MRRLTGADAHFLAQETRAQHLHTLKIFIVDHSRSPHGYSYERVREQMARVVRHVGPYRWRLVKVPFGLGLPLWIDDPELDLDYHLRRAAAPAPGGPRELSEVLSIIASFPLERDRPLWQLWVVEGLAEGHVAHVMKIHHALADGGSSARLLVESTAVAEAPSAPEESSAPLAHGDRQPTAGRLVADALGTAGRLAFRLPALVRRSLRVLAIGAQRRRLGQPAPPRPYSSPPTRFNRPLTPHRWYACATLPLADVGLVRRAFDVTVNDVLLSLTSAAVRSYLLDHDELPATSLTASVPISIRRPDERPSYGNRLATWYVPLGTDLADPVARLRLVAQGAAVARETIAAKDRELQHDWMEQWVLWNLFWRRGTRLMRRLRKRPVFNLIVSNVRGPAEPISYEGSRLVAIQSMGPLMGDMGLNVTAWSYVDHLSVGIVACREHVPDIWNLADRFAPALEELARAARASSGPGERMAAAS